MFCIYANICSVQICLFSFLFQNYGLFRFLVRPQSARLIRRLPMDYNTKAHSVYLLTYHIVFVTKYRRPVITDEIGDFMKNHAAYLCGRFGGEMLSGETDRDHMHLLVSMPPEVAPSRLVTTLKTQLSKEVRMEYAEHVRKHLWNDAPFWSSSYFIASTGTTVMEKAKEYIEGQRTDEHKRKYVKRGKYAKKRKA